MLHNAWSLSYFLVSYFNMPHIFWLTLCFCPSQKSGYLPCPLSLFITSNSLSYLGSISWCLWSLYPHCYHHLSSCSLSDSLISQHAFCLNHIQSSSSYSFLLILHGLQGNHKPCLWFPHPSMTHSQILFRLLSSHFSLHLLCVLPLPLSGRLHFPQESFTELKFF